MRRGIILLILSVLLPVLAVAQLVVPNRLAIQGVARDGNGAVVSQRMVSLRLTITEGGESGRVVYREIQTAVTSDQGHYALMLGCGYPMLGSFDAINWAAGTYFLRTDYDFSSNPKVTSPGVPVFVNGVYKTSLSQVDTTLHFLDGTTFQQLASVPYAFAASRASETDELPFEYIDEMRQRGDEELAGLESALKRRLSSLENGPGVEVIEDCEGALPGAFSVGEGSVVFFSKGNLQYAGKGSHNVIGGGTAKGTWRFAAHQYEALGEANSKVSPTNTAFIDLFGWGTSGYEKAYPYNRGALAQNQYGTPGADISGTNFDWGVYNAISNGGNEPALWRTLSYKEWYYLINGRAEAAQKWARATVCGVGGLLLLPDEWVMPQGISITPGSASRYGNNTFTPRQWSQMEKAGAVFLPDAGYRTSATVTAPGKGGRYWTSTAYDAENARSMIFGASTLNTGNSYYLYAGRSVRLVRGNTVKKFETITACDSLQWHGTTYRKGGLYTFVEGDTVYTLSLTLHQSSLSVNAAQACDTFAWHEGRLTESGDYSFVSLNVDGCPQTDSLYLTVAHSFDTSYSAVACESYLWRGRTLTATNRYFDTVGKAIAGVCDSVFRLTLRVDAPHIDSISRTVCESYLWRGTTYTESGRYEAQVPNTLAGACDTTFVLQLTVYPNTKKVAHVLACDSFLWHETLYTVGGAYGLSELDANGCTATDSLYLVVSHTFDTSYSVMACESFLWHGRTLTQSNRYTDTLRSAIPGGCDSVHHLKLLVDSPVVDTTSASACEGFFWRGNTYDRSGYYEARDANAIAGACDTIHVLAFLALESSHNVLVPSLAEADETYEWRGHVYNANGVYTFAYLNEDRCPSVDTLKLTLANDRHMVQRDTICASQRESTYTGRMIVDTLLFETFDGYAEEDIPAGWYGATQTSWQYPFAAVSNVNAGGNYVYPPAGNGKGKALLTLSICEEGAYVLATTPLISVKDPANTYYAFDWIKRQMGGDKDEFYVRYATEAQGMRNIQGTNILRSAKGESQDLWKHASGSFADCNMIAGKYYLKIVNIDHAGLAAGIDNLLVYTAYKEDLTAFHEGETFEDLAYSVDEKGARVYSGRTVYIVPSTEESTIVACNSYVWRGVAYDTTGIYENRVGGAAAHGCDSLYRLNLTVHTTQPQYDDEVACNTYRWHNRDYSATGKYGVEYEDEYGCRVTDSLSLTLFYDVVIADTIYTPQSSYDWRGRTLVSNGQFTDIVRGAVWGVCDSVYRLTLLTSVRFDSICAGQEGSTTGHMQTAFDGTSDASLQGWTYDQRWMIASNENNYLSANHETPVYQGYQGKAFFCPTYYGAFTISTSHLVSPAIAIKDPLRTSLSFKFLAVKYSDGRATGYNTLHLEWSTSPSGPWHEMWNSGGGSIDSWHSYSTNLGALPTPGTYYFRITNSGKGYVSAVDNFVVAEDMNAAIPEIVSEALPGSTISTTETFFVPGRPDSTVTTLWFVKPNTVGFDTVSSLPNQVWGDRVFRESGDYQVTGLRSANGCDSVANVHVNIVACPDKADSLTSRHNEVVEVEAQACTTYAWRGKTINATGRYSDSVRFAVDGVCDSIYHLNVVILEGSHQVERTDTGVVCDSYTWHDAVYRADGMYTYAYLDENGCESLDTLILTLTPPANRRYTFTACGAYTWELNGPEGHGTGATYENYGIYVGKPYLSPEGCRSVDTLMLTVKPTASQRFEHSVCGSFTWDSTGEYGRGTGRTYDTTGVYTSIPVLAENGCEDADTLVLTVYNYGSRAYTLTACADFVWESNGNYGHGTGATLDSTGIYVGDAYLTAEGCESTDTLFLTVNRPESGCYRKEVCDAYTWLPDGTEGFGDSNTYTTTGTYYHNYSNAAGCDVHDTLMLTVNHSASDRFTQTACDFYYWFAQSAMGHGTGDTCLASGIYLGNPYTSSEGCESVDTLVLTLDTSHVFYDSMAVCNGYEWRGNAYTQSGRFEDVVPNGVAGACDTTFVLDLQVFVETHTVVTPTKAEADESYTWHHVVYDANGTYTYAYTNADGCESVDTLKLTLANDYHLVQRDTICASQRATYVLGAPHFDTLFIETFDATAEDAVPQGWYSVTETNSQIPLMARAVANNDGRKVYPPSGNGKALMTLGSYDNEKRVNAATPLVTISAPERTYFSFDWIKKQYDGDKDVFDVRFATQTQGQEGVDGTILLHSDNTQAQDTWTSATGILADYGMTPGSYYFKFVYYDYFGLAAGIDNFVIYQDNTPSLLSYQEGETYRDVVYEEDENGNRVYTGRMIYILPATADTTVVACNSYSWNGSTYDASGVYNHRVNGVAQKGCDSLYVLHLSVVSSTPQSETQIACDSYRWHERNYTESGIYQYSNACGVDDTLVLTIVHTVYNTEYRESCEPYSWHGAVRSQSGTYVFEYTTDGVCTNVDSLHFTLHPSTAGDTVASACDSFSWFEHSGISASCDNLTHTLTDIHGCDSVVTLHLTINTPVHNVYTETVCGNYRWNRNRYTTTGTYTYEYTDTNNCPAADTLHLTVYYDQYSGKTMASCEPYDWRGRLLETSGNYTDTAFGAVHGVCDSIYSLNLTVFTPGHNAYTEVACENFFWMKTLYNASGNYTYDYTDTNNCPATDTLHLTVFVPQSSVENITHCGPYSWHGNVYETSGTYTDTVADAVGGVCDSTFTLNLTVHTPDHSLSVDTVCERYDWHDSLYTVSGIYTYIYMDANNCPATDSLALTVYNSQRSIEEVASCETYTWRGQIIAITTTVTDTVRGAVLAVCDSLYVLNLTVNTPAHNVYHESGCENYRWNRTRYAESGTYSYDYTDSNNCAATDTLHLTIYNHIAAESSATSCGAYTRMGVTHEQSGTYTDTIRNAVGGVCDSIVTLTLSVFPVHNTVETEAVCESYQWNGTDYAASGTYIHTYTDGNNCAATDTLHLTVYTPQTAEESRTQCSPYHWHDLLCEHTGTYFDTVSNVVGGVCDSIYILHFELFQAVNVVDEHSICQGTSLDWYGKSYTTAVLDSSVRHTFLDHEHGDCPVDSILVLTVSTPPSVSLADVTSSAGNAFCSGTSTSLGSSLLSSYGTVTYEWSVSPAETNAGLASANAVSTTATPTNTGAADVSYAYTLTATAQSVGCPDATASKSITVTVHPGAVAPVVEGDLKMCPASFATARISDASFNPAATYKWYQDGGLIQSSTEQTFVAEAIGAYTVEATLGECSTPKTAFNVTERTISINPSVSASPSEFRIGNSTTLSVGNLGASVQGGNATYSWSCVSANAYAAGLFDTEGQSVSAQPTEKGTYTFQVEVNYEYQGCQTSATKTVTVNVTPDCQMPTISVKWERLGPGYTNVPCVLKSTVSVSPSNSTVTYQWGRYSSTTSTFASTPTYAIEDILTGPHLYLELKNTATLYYDLTVTATNGECVATKNYRSSISSSGFSTSGGEIKTTVTKSGSTISVSGTATKNTHNMCASAVVITQNTDAFVPSNNTISLKSSGTGSTAKSITINLGSTPPSGTKVRVYTWFTSSSGCTSSSQSKISYTDLTY